MGSRDCTLSKVVLVTINVIFMIFGLASLITGIIFKLGWDDVRHAFADKSDDVDINLQDAGDTVAYSAIVVGVFIVILSFFGCVGAWCRVNCLLAVYAIVVLLLLVGQIVIVALAVNMGTHSEDKIAKGLRDTLKNYRENSTTDESKAFSYLFANFRCCGVKNYTTDFTTDDGPNVPFYPALSRSLVKYPLEIPITCCRGVDYEAKLDAAVFDKHSECLTNPTDEHAYTEGCLDKIEDEIEKNKGIFIGVGVTIFVIEILVILLSFVMCCRDDD